jgi:hypothetical protein
MFLGRGGCGLAAAIIGFELVFIAGLQQSGRPGFYPLPGREEKGVRRE